MKAMPAPTVALLAPPSPRFLFKRAKSFFKISSQPQKFALNCSKSSSEEKEIGGLKEALSGAVGKQVEELMNRDENQGLMEGLEKASRRVERARKELAEIAKHELEAKLLRDQINQLETRVSEIAECQRELVEARTLVEEAEHSLLLNMATVGPEEAAVKERQEIDKDEERWESVKVAIISALLGTFAGLPLSLTQVTSTSQFIFLSSATFISCALFGVTYRYTVRRDLDNFQLKTGTSAAFGIVKGLATLAGGSPLELDTESFLLHSLSGVVYVSENLFIFIFAAVGLDFCFKMRFLCPFPIRKA